MCHLRITKLHVAMLPKQRRRWWTDGYDKLCNVNSNMESFEQPPPNIFGYFCTVRVLKWWRSTLDESTHFEKKIIHWPDRVWQNSKNASKTAILRKTRFIPFFSDAQTLFLSWIILTRLVSLTVNSQKQFENLSDRKSQNETKNVTIL